MDTMQDDNTKLTVERYREIMEAVEEVERVKVLEGGRNTITLPPYPSTLSYSYTITTTTDTAPFPSASHDFPVMSTWNWDRCDEQVPRKTSRAEKRIEKKLRDIERRS